MLANILNFPISQNNTDNCVCVIDSFGNQLLRVVVYKPSWFLQMVVNEEKENFFQVSTTYFLFALSL